MNEKVISYLKELNEPCFIYGSSLYLENYRDIDVTVLSNQFNKKVVHIDDTELHINLLPKEIILSDLEKNTFGEYFIGKFMNPLLYVTFDDSLEELRKSVLTKKIHESLTKLNSTFKAKEVFLMIGLLRALEFPEYIVVVDEMYKNINSPTIQVHLELINKILNEICSVDKVDSNTFFNRDFKDDSVTAFIKNYDKIIRYWQVFIEFHNNDVNSITRYRRSKDPQKIEFLFRKYFKNISFFSILD